MPTHTHTHTMPICTHTPHTHHAYTHTYTHDTHHAHTQTTHTGREDYLLKIVEEEVIHLDNILRGEVKWRSVTHHQTFEQVCWTHHTNTCTRSYILILDSTVQEIQTLNQVQWVSAQRTGNMTKGKKEKKETQTLNPAEQVWPGFQTQRTPRCRTAMALHPRCDEWHPQKGWPGKWSDHIRPQGNEGKWKLMLSIGTEKEGKILIVSDRIRHVWNSLCHWSH